MKIKLSQDQVKGIRGRFTHFNEVCFREDEKSGRILNLIDCLSSVWNQKLFDTLSKSFEMVDTLVPEYEFTHGDIESMQEFCKIVSEIIHAQITRYAIQDGALEQDDLVMFDSIKKAIDIHVLESLGIEKKPGLKDLKDIPEKQTRDR